MFEIGRHITKNGKTAVVVALVNEPSINGDPLLVGYVTEHGSATPAMWNQAGHFWSDTPMTVNDSLAPPPAFPLQKDFVVALITAMAKLDRTWTTQQLRSRYPNTYPTNSAVEKVIDYVLASS